VLERPTELALFARFPPSWDHIDPLRQCADVAIRTRAGGVTADKASIVVQELLENAVKYGVPTSDIEFEVLVAKDGSSFDVRVRNKALSSRLTVLSREFQRVAGDSARDSFNRALHRLQRLPPGTSMLGLSRVAMESMLQLEVAEDRVTITARVEIVSSPSPKR
jgi:hypothetical protein